VPEEAKPVLRRRQDVLMRTIKKAGINAYDPGSSAKYSPDMNNTAQPTEVYMFDSARVAAARYLCGHNILPSDGKGNEMEKAVVLNRVPVMLMDRGIRVSRMLPTRTIYLAYDDFEAEAGRLVPVFQMLKEYEPGMGFNGNKPAPPGVDSSLGMPVLLGFDSSGRVVDLEDEVYSEFPGMRFEYDGRADIVRLRVANPDIFKPRTLASGPK
jgi:hypothetical protein